MSIVKPKIAIVGRPNTGKSTLFNKLVGKRISIVKDEAGITRDRIYADSEWCGQEFTLIDTGGIDIKDITEMGKHIKEQAQIAIDLADLILIVVDGKIGLQEGDLDATKVLRKTDKPVFVVVNKIDNVHDESGLYDFYSLGFKDIFPISSTHGNGTGDLLDAIFDTLKTSVPNLQNKMQDEGEEEGKSVIKICMVGRPNAGKSSIINKITNQNRLVVSAIAGTTRDAIDLPFRWKNQDFVLIDTAGMRKKAGIEPESVERYSVVRSLDAIERADVCVVVVDITEGLAEQDINILDYITQQGKPSLLVLNKWDLITDKDNLTINKYSEEIKSKLSFMSWVKMLFVSAESGQRIFDILAGCMQVYENAHRRITTGTLNELLSNAINLNQPPNIKTKRLKLMYATEASVLPPKFVLFVNDEQLSTENYKRYLENFLRKSVDFSGTPIQVEFRSRKEDKE